MKEENDKELIINAIKKHYGMKTDATFASYLGVKPNTVATWRSRNTLDYELIVAKCNDINANWLITGKGDMLINARSKTNKELEEGVPLVRIEAFGGTGNAAFSIEKHDILGRYIVPEFEEADFMLRVKGSSMSPRYNSGDVVACRILKQRIFIQWNKVHVIGTKEQGILIKRIRKGPTKDTVTAISDNTDYDPFDVPWEEITGIALVMGVIRLE